MLALLSKGMRSAEWRSDVLELYRRTATELATNTTKEVALLREEIRSRGARRGYAPKAHEVL